MALLRYFGGLWLKLGDCNLAFLRSKYGPKLVGKGVASLALLRSLTDPPLESERFMAFLRTTIGSRKLVGRMGLVWHCCDLLVSLP